MASLHDNVSDNKQAATDERRTRLLPEAPSDYGLLFLLNSKSCQLSFCPDSNLKELHPNIYAPQSLTQINKLTGGGSGVTVFQGTLPQCGGSVVLKHGSHKDTEELFALATIAEQLKIRGTQCKETAQDMQDRIPEFKAIYLSPWHFRERNAELWGKLRAVLYAFRWEENGNNKLGFENFMRRRNVNGPKKSGRIMRLYSTEEEEEEVSSNSNGRRIVVHKEYVDITLDAHNHDIKNKQDLSLQHGSASGYQALKPLVECLVKIQKERFWKFTLAQKTIGGQCPRTGAELLAAGLLHGELLRKLIDEFITVVHDLQGLTLPQEKSAVEEIRKELNEIESNPNLSSECVSKLADTFCGNAIRKNYHPALGRFFRLRRMGKEFRSGDLVLEPQEEIPARFLGILLQPGSQMNQAYLGVPQGDTAIDLKMDTSWRTLLRDATSLQSKAALERIWSCGLEDAGIHNLFFSENKLWLFDLGEPTLQPLPGFLTKFLFSFFHTLGMEDDGKGSWVKRFVVEDDLLAPTSETKLLLAQAHAAFEVVLEEIVERLFEGEEKVRPLLIRYMVLQLLSDTSFCLEKWAIKGGGQEKLSNHHLDNEKWLWRSLWDMYVAFDVNTRYAEPK